MKKLNEIETAINKIRTNINMIDLSKEAIEYCNKIKGKNHAGCGSDIELCKLCRTGTIGGEQLDINIKRINKYVQHKFKLR